MSEFVILGVLWEKKMESVWSSFCINYNSCRGERMKDTGRLMASLTEIGSAQEPIRISLTLISSDDMKTVSVPSRVLMPGCVCMFYNTILREITCF